MKMLFSFRPWASTFSRARASASVQSLPALISCASEVLADPVPDRRPGAGAPPRRFQVNRVDADGAEEAKVPRVELVDGDLVLDVHQATGRLRWFWPP